ncbi:MAG: site-specific integrase, partial [Sedimentibacter sp.]
MKYKKKNDTNFWKVTRSFLHEYMPVVRNLSDKSVEAYKQSLNSYLAFLKEELAIENAGVCFEFFDHNNIKKYIVWLKEKKNYFPKTIYLKLTAIKSFLKYSSDERHR